MPPEAIILLFLFSTIRKYRAHQIIKTIIIKDFLLVLWFECSFLFSKEDYSVGKNGAISSDQWKDLVGFSIIWERSKGCPYQQVFLLMDGSQEPRFLWVCLVCLWWRKTNQARGMTFKRAGADLEWKVSFHPSLVSLLLVLEATPVLSSLSPCTRFSALTGIEWT